MLRDSQLKYGVNIFWFFTMISVTELQYKNESYTFNPDYFRILLGTALT
jgi:hypothetical protein